LNACINNYKMMKRLIVDLDDTISVTDNGDYLNSRPVVPLIEKLREYKANGFEIVIQSSRNMRTYESNIGKINIYTLPNIINWLNKYDVPFDELYIGKPWCGFEGFYIDDKTIRPSEFINLTYEQIQDLLKKEKANII
jgi:capsule biosynthesis phosphatase